MDNVEKQKQWMSGQISAIPGIVSILLVVGIFLGVAFLVLTQFAAVSTNANATNAINNTVSALNNFVNFLPVIVIIAAAAVVLSLVTGFARV